MHEIGRGSTPPSAEDIEVFSTLRTVEPSERVTIRLDEHSLQLAGRKGNNANVRLGAIDQTVHHSTTLMPNWTMVVGAVCLWIGYRVMLDPMFRFGFVGFGVALIAARLFTRKPTVTVTTTTGDAYVMVGREHELARLQFMLNKVMSGLRLPIARRQWDRRERALLNGTLADELEADEPVVIHHPVSLNTLLHDQGEDVEAPEPVEMEVEPEWKPTDPPMPSSPYLPADSPVHAFQFHQETAGYEQGHRPVPTRHPVLVTVPPPMHQPTNTASQNGFIPNFWNGDQVHIPATPTLPTEEELAETPPDGELGHAPQDDDNASIEQAPAAETAPAILASRPQHSVSPAPSRKLVNRVPGRTRLFTPRKSRGLVVRHPPAHGFVRVATDAIQHVRNRFTGRELSQTEVELRNAAQRTNIEMQKDGRFDSIGHQISQDAIERLEAQANQLLAVSASLEGGSVALDGLSFNELQSTVGEDEPSLGEW